MTREWKPGDVAMVCNEHGVWNRAILQVQPVGLRWVYGVAFADAPLNWPTRPVVVIDPEDRDQVRRFIKAQDDAWDEPDEDRLDWDDAIVRAQRALRSLVAPPKPDEPTGLGAVVEDAEGRKWVRHEHDSGRLDKRHAWYPAGWIGDGVRITWDDIPAVRVLSEGVQP